MRRTFQFFGEFDETDEEFHPHDRDEVRTLLLDLEASVYQLGGVITMSAIRQQVGDDAYVTTGMLVNYDSFSPAAKMPERTVADVEREMTEAAEISEIPAVEDAST